MFLKNRSRVRSGKRNGGFLLIEVALALVLISMIAIPQLVKDWSDMRDSQAQAQGLSLKTLQGAANTYMTDYANQLLNPVVVFPVPALTPADRYNPTIAELIALNVGLPRNFSNRAILGGGFYRVRVEVVAGNIEGLAWADKAIKTDGPGGSVDSSRIGIAMREIGSDSASSSPESPTLIHGFAGKWDGPNPVAGTAGILAVRTGYGSSGLTQFIRRDGSLSATANHDWGGNDITNINKVGVKTVETETLTATGLVKADRLEAGDTKVTTLTATSATVSGRIEATGVDGQIRANSRLTANEYLQVNGIGSVGAGCPSPGLLAWSATGMVQCVGGAWKEIGKSSKTTFFEVGTPGKGSDGACFQPNIASGGCYCPSGTAAQQLVGFAYHWQPWDGIIYACVPS